MSELIASGRIVDAILVLVVIEAVALTVYHRHTGRGVKPLDLYANLLAGATLLLALRAALSGWSWEWIGAALSAALAAHLLDLGRRWRR